MFVTMDLAEYAAVRRTTLFRTAVLLGCPEQDADDLVQVTLTKCVRHWGRIARAENPDAYVYKVMLNAFRDTRARRWHGEVPTEVVPDQGADDPDVAAALAIRRAVAQLTEEHRAVLVLRFYADLSERETAKVLGIPAGTVKSRTARALAALSQDVTLARSNDAH
jgi:RNA polymerase sigma-70 factor (sigma-E family)